MLVKYRNRQAPTTVQHDAVGEDKIEKLFIQPKELFEAIDFSELDVIDASEKHSPKFIEGENYVLCGTINSTLKVSPKVYKLIKVVDKFYGIDLDAVIVKQIAGEEGIIFTLSRNDCEYYGIEFETGLQIYSKRLNWVRVKDKIPFNPKNLATTPLSDIDNTIRFILLRLRGFKDYSDGYVVTPSGHLVSEKHFADTLRIKANEPIVYGNGCILQDKTNLDVKLVYPKGVLFNHGNFISSEDAIYIMIRLKRQYTTLQDEKISVDGCFGVEPVYFDSISPNDFFEISWDELGAYTIEEYEAIKAERARKEAERIKAIEEERKRKLAEKEAKIREQDRRVNEAINRMKNYHIDNIVIPDFSKITFNGSISSMDMIVNTLDNYFGQIDNSIETLGKDINDMISIGKLFIPFVEDKNNVNVSDFNKLLELL